MAEYGLEIKTMVYLSANIWFWLISCTPIHIANVKLLTKFVNSKIYLK